MQDEINEKTIALYIKTGKLTAQTLPKAMNDDHLTVESPGTLPGIVRLNNMREIHFSRNPKIAEFLHEYEYVREFGEGVDRMYLEMKEAGLPEPEYRKKSGNC